MANTWFNPDNLFVRFGTAKATASIGGEYSNVGGLREIELELDLTTLTSTAAIIENNVFFPKSVRIEEVEVVVVTAATGATATLNVGLIQADRTTNVSDTEFVNALAVTSLTPAGEKNVLRVGTTGAGAGIGATTAATGYITAKWGTAAFTAGKVIIRIRYNVP